MSSGCRVKWEGQKVKKKISEVALEALWLMGQDLITESTNDAPLDTGTLRRSATVTVSTLPDAGQVYSTAKTGEKTQTSPGKTFAGYEKKVFVSYNTPYAIRLHEDLSWTPRGWKKTASGNVVEKPAVGGPKWLENNVNKVTKRHNKGMYLKRAKEKAGIA